MNRPMKIATLWILTLAFGLSAHARTNGAGSSPKNAGQIQQATPDTVQSPSGTFDMTSYFRRGVFAPAVQSIGRTSTIGLSSSNLPEYERASCEKSYRRILARRQMEIRLGFGYMDISEGQSYIFEGVPYPNSTSLDIFGRRAFVQTLMASCNGNMQACGFAAVNGDQSTLAKNIVGPTGENIQVIVRLTNGSVSPNYEDNTLSLSTQQLEQTEAANDLFFGGVKSADALVYMGHSRNGGGVDFAPPVLKSNGHPNYTGYYMPKKPGFGHLLRELNAPGENPALIAILSCLSEAHFGRSLAKFSKDTGFVFTGSPVLADYNKIMPTGLAAVDSMMRFQCHSGFQDEINAAYPDDPRAFLRYFGESSANARN